MLPALLNRISEEKLFNIRETSFKELRRIFTPISLLWICLVKTPSFSFLYFPVSERKNAFLLCFLYYAYKNTLLFCMKSSHVQYIMCTYLPAWRIFMYNILHEHFIFQCFFFFLFFVSYHRLRCSTYRGARTPSSWFYQLLSPGLPKHRVVNR